ncbi:hypothetical protein HD554DRAFT_2172869 [Boletus coccyginus]|nr:hypothetical protein HD554DRAFT_2172869 [Boletus coccyginus]
MSSAQAVQTSITQNNSMALATLTAAGYDYILTFSDEIEYVWNKPWSWVSMLFIIIRYFGLSNVVIISLTESTFLPGSPMAYVFVPSSLSGLPNTTDFY